MSANRVTHEIQVLEGPPTQWAGDALALAVYQEGHAQPALAGLGEPVAELVKRALAGGWTRGREGQALLLPLPDGAGLKVERLLLVGLGKGEGITPERLRNWGANLAEACDNHGIASVLTLLPLDRPGGLKAPRVARCIAEGVWLGRYRFDVYQEKPEDEPEGITLARVTVAAPADKVARCTLQLKRAREVAGGVYLARDLANQPGNVLNPEYLAETARRLSQAFPAIRTAVLDENALRERGMNAILAVGQGSANPPRLITMEYRQGGEEPPLAVVGKGITFDSGGISIKPSQNMEEMKYDMCGAAAVLGFMRAVAAMGLPINVVGIVASAENMPSGTAQRPGDIVRTAKGLHVEVINTDAEGRLVLADALHHAEGFEPRAVIDLATLTGACIVALGNVAAGLLGNDDRLCRELEEAGEHSGELLWRLPLFDAYQEQIKSKIADIKNTGGREAGTSTAACFLSRFVGENRRWAHLDIAGVDNYPKGKKAYVPEGPLGFGVRLLCRLVERQLS